MSIVSSVYEMDAGRHVIQRFEDHLGNRYMHTYFAPVGWWAAELEARLALDAGGLEERLAEAEIEKLLGEG